MLYLISKIFKKLIQKQIVGFVDYFLSSYICGFRKRFHTQQMLFALIKNWEKVLESKGFGRPVLMDVSKEFDAINHNLLIAKLHEYGFSNDSL